jgi:Zn-finger nucleic acid-binding protein
MDAWLCPRCGEALAAVDLSDRGLPRGASACGGCGGLLLDGAEVLARVERLSRLVVVEVRRIPDAATQQEPLPCPRCGVDSLMRKMRATKDPAVLLDVCERCDGIWLDEGELEALQTESLLDFARGVLRALSD